MGFRTAMAAILTASLILQGCATRSAAGIQGTGKAVAGLASTEQGPPTPAENAAPAKPPRFWQGAEWNREATWPLIITAIAVAAVLTIGGKGPGKSQGGGNPDPCSSVLAPPADCPGPR